MGIERFTIGGEVFCGEHSCGRLSMVAVERATDRLEHLIVDPGRGRDPRLVPAAMAHAAADVIRLDCTRQEFDAMQPAAVIHVAPGEPDGSTAGHDEKRRWSRHDEVLPWPVFGLGSSVPNPTVGAPVPMPMPEPRIEVEDHVPPTEVRVYDDRVHTADDCAIGHVAGVAVDTQNGKVTHILLDEGHLWGRKRVAIPMSLVEDIDAEGVSVRLSKRQVKDLPPDDDGSG